MWICRTCVCVCGGSPSNTTPHLEVCNPNKHPPIVWKVLRSLESERFNFSVSYFYSLRLCVNLRFNNNIQTPIEQFFFSDNEFCRKNSTRSIHHPLHQTRFEEKKCQRTAWDNWRMWPSTFVIWAEVVEVSESWFTVVALPNLLKRNRRRSSMFSCSEEDIHTLRHSTVCCSSSSSWDLISWDTCFNRCEQFLLRMAEKYIDQHFLHFLFIGRMTKRKRKSLCAWLQE